MREKKQKKEKREKVRLVQKARGSEEVDDRKKAQIQSAKRPQGWPGKGPRARDGDR